MIAALQTLLLVLIPSDAVADDKERLFQFGLVPPVSSNGSNSGRTVNAISVNLIGGYSAGTRISEVYGMPPESLRKVCSWQDC